MLNKSITGGYHCQDSIKITKEQWKSLLKDEKIITKKELQLFEVMYDCYGYNVTGKQLSQKLEMPHPTLNHQVGELGKRIAKKLEIQTSSLQYGGVKRWIIPFCGKRTRDGYCWKLRLELQEAMEEILEEPIAEEIKSEHRENFYEGAITQIYVNSYERNRKARNECVRHYGARCMICGFDFEKRMVKLMFLRILFVFLSDNFSSGFLQAA